MKKALFILLMLIFSSQLALAVEPFCGRSTFGFCLSDSDCQAGGCSNQVCERKGEGTVTTCEFRDCYVAENYNLTCQCIDNKCQWGYSGKTPFEAEPTTSKLKVAFGFLTSVNPFIFLILGVLLIIAAKLAKFVGIVLIILGLVSLLFWFFA
jgi:eight-cysteine-cluster-containing protein